jgi:hypothetical protein
MVVNVKAVLHLETLLAWVLPLAYAHYLLG